MWYWLFKYLMFLPIVKVLLRPKWEGGENIPVRGAAILACNHLDAGDTFTLPALMRRKLIIPAKKELFSGKTVSTKAVAWFLTRVGMVPLDRSGGRAGAGGLGPIEQKLHDGYLAGIFPEGSRSPDGRLYRGHTGVARMALDMNMPVIPVGMVNTKLCKNRIGLPTMKNARVVVGEPIDYSAWAGQSDDMKTLRWITDDIMAHIQQLTGQEYVDVYSMRVKHGNLKNADLSRYEKPAPNEGVLPPLVKSQGKTTEAGSAETGSGSE